MATIFVDPGGDATFDISLWPTTGGGTAPVVATDFVHGGHIKSYKFAVNSFSDLIGSGGASDAGGRISVWIYLNALPTSTAPLFQIEQTGDGNVVAGIYVTSSGVLQILDFIGAQQGSNGATLTTGAWNRLCFAWTITSSTVNQLRLFLNGVQTITSSNGTLNQVNSADIQLGNGNADATLDFRASDYYVDNSTALTDPGNIWVTAKRPFTNGTTIGFTTQIGSGGSGYGSGHTPQVNERPRNDTNGWSVIAAGSAITEEYNIEGQSVGDINITGSTIVDYMGWIRSKSLASETGKIIVNGVSTNISLTSTIKLFIKIAGSTTYPAGTGADIGEISATTATTVSLYEAGIAIAYIPAVVAPTFSLGYKSLLRVGK